MAIWSKLFTLGRAGAHDATTAIVDANAMRILDQELRDADAAQGKARDDLAGLVARRRILENEVESLRAQSAKYEASARAAMAKNNMDLAREVAQRVADLERGPVRRHLAQRRLGPDLGASAGADRRRRRQ